MSADSPRRSGSRVTRQGGGGGQVVVPQRVTDPSIIDSVTGFINDVVPQAYTSTLPGDSKETITWARFESADINDPGLFPDNTSDAVLPLILILGYNTGVQVWAIPANGEATEVLSWSQGSVRTLRILPSPSSVTSRSSDFYSIKRPLVAICDSAGPGPPFCSVSFISLKTGDQVKSIKFKNPVCDVYANRRSVIVTFPERIAVFDACSLEDRLSITSCFLSPGPNANPVALGSRWLAFAEKKLVAWQRSSGGVGGGAAQSYTATVLHAAQTLGRGLRGLSETVASSLTGPRNHTGGQIGILGSSPPTMNGTDHSSPGIVTVLDLEAASNRYNGADEGHSAAAEGVLAHFIAHSEAIVALEFDPSGTLLLTADKRGHDFHIFRLQPHPSGSSLAAVHHLYVLHRGDTTAKVQNVAFSCDSRWVAVSTMRGTTHVFPLTPYGGPVGFRTHGSPLVVNRLSRFHRSAGLSADGRSSPVPSPESPPCLPSGPHANPRLPPYPHPASQSPLAQLRQSPHPPLAPAGPLDVSLRVCATFASPRAWLLDSQTSNPRDGPRDSSKVPRRPVDSLFVMACHGNLVQYDLDPKPVIIGPREKICDDTQIELDVEAKAEWPLQRSPHSPEVLPPLPPMNPLLCGVDLRTSSCDSENNGHLEERWLSQVEIVTHAGPHRRLWMGPQITFKTYTTTNAGSSLQDVEAIEVGTVPVSRPARSNPVNMPPGGRPVVPVLIESGSGSSFEQSPHLLEVYGADSGDAEHWGGHGDSRLREDLADAMLESPGAPSREKGQRRYFGLVGGGDELGEGRVVRGGGVGPVRRVVNPGGAEITMLSDGEESDTEHHWEAIAIPATAPDSDSFPREMVTTIAAAELQRPTSQLVLEPPSKLSNPAEKTTIRDKGSNKYSVGKASVESDVSISPVKLFNQRKSNESCASKKGVLSKSGSNSSVSGSLVTPDKGASIEKVSLGSKEGSAERDLPISSEQGKGLSDKDLDNAEPTVMRKKGKKTTLLKELEQCAKLEGDSNRGSSDSFIDDTKSVDISFNRKGKVIPKVAEASHVVSEKVVGKMESIRDNSEISENRLSRKSPSPQKYERRESPSPVKEQSGNSPSPQKNYEKVDTTQIPPIVMSRKSISPQKDVRKKSPSPLKNVEKVESTQSNAQIPPKVMVRKSNSPPKDVESKSVKKNTLISEKNVSDDVVSLKKSKRKAPLSKESSREDESCVEFTQTEKGNEKLLELKDELGSALRPEKGRVTDFRESIEFGKGGVAKETLGNTLEVKGGVADDELVLLGRDSHVCDAVGAELSQDITKQESETLELSKNLKKVLKGQQDLVEKFVLKSSCLANDVSVERSGCNTGTKKSKKKAKLEREEKSVAEEHFSTTFSGESSVKTARIGVDHESDIISKFEGAVMNDLEIAAHFDEASAPLKETAVGDRNVVVETGISSAVNQETVALGFPDLTVTKTVKKGSKLVKKWNSNVESEGLKPKPETRGAIISLEPTASDMWSIPNDSGKLETENFPPLTSKHSKKPWGMPFDESSNILNVDEKDGPIKKKADKNELDPEMLSSCVADHETSKLKRGWELPTNVNYQNVNSTEMDIDQLTFEDLEAIVDAACKESDTKVDLPSSKGNKKGKKDNPNNSTLSQITDVVESLQDDVTILDLGKVVNVPKPIEELKEEPVKSLEKPVSTPNRNSKAQRRKRR